ncbi:diphosphomevalonate decarboxylase [Candidatus Peribacteria bacterium RIFCSPHIGHO2_02_FULL_49_16]|nr:MAG: diphosphomevalonate decarboxylase [Candidatus Peribacteria bacterium RIFCSPHIGHO2_01_FULL_49_38]OGJ58568.1 MAG: diphosphomevalonate decarboxylase [Candidatus Peribacteria bacterium RIFCSPHIGHO2_02_FULL_49_16]
MISVISTPNIAFTKYWGNRNENLRLPANDSLSMTLDSPTVRISIEPAETFSVRSWNVDGSEKTLSEKNIARFHCHRELVNRYLATLQTEVSIIQPSPRLSKKSLRGAGWSISNYQLSIRSQIPSAIGLASSAAVFSGVAKAYGELLRREGLELTDEQISIIARLGSGSACRSIQGGFVAIDAGIGDTIDSAKAVQIADNDHWPLHDIVIAPSLEEKKVGSTEGHRFAHTSPCYAERLRQMSRRQRECINAIRTRDFEKLQRVSEKDALDLHKVAETSNPPLQYLNQETHRIIGEIETLRKEEHLAVLFTMDAGPTVHLVCTEESRDRIARYAHNQPHCTVFETKVGSGAHCQHASTSTLS